MPGGKPKPPKPPPMPMPGGRMPAKAPAIPGGMFAMAPGGGGPRMPAKPAGIEKAKPPGMPGNVEPGARMPGKVGMLPIGPDIGPELPVGSGGKFGNEGG
mmetsp:Transcript_45647/g.74137  ORF Transcript_45647/g.74137 Transcript_45647/m.74137 type:complete len:100 (-) Transcript_45647:144-443(-)